MKEGARFLQSAGDFPCMVELGGKVPAWGLNRWGVPGLRFLPFYNEGFVLRGNRRQMLYKGEKQSHRFTILDQDKFEYDCILNKEPGSNTVMLRLDGAERFDFFKQPEFIKNPLLAGSYAVYRKTCLTEPGGPCFGTGKLCHIHKPKIIDAAGKSVWGSLDIRGNVLAITIPESWLARAEYPVIVDPVVGLTTLGALGPEDESEDENSYWGFNDYDGMGLTWNMGVNQFTAPHNICGNCTAHLYVDYYPGDYHWSTTEEKVWPVLYTHDSQKGRPGIMKSSGGGYISNDVGRKSGPPRGWRSTDITVDGTIQQGQVFWFGFHFIFMQPRFDYGGRLYRCTARPYQSTYVGLRQKFYNYPMNIETNYYEDERGNEIEYEMWVEPSYELKISMYLEYTGPPASYARTLTQGVSLADSRKLTGAYKRAAIENVNGNTVLGRMEGFYRKCIIGAGNIMLLKREPVFIRTAIEWVKVAMSTDSNRGIRRDVEDNILAEGGTIRKQGFYRSATNLIKTNDSIKFQVLVSRLVHEWLNTTDVIGHWGDYLRGLFVEARSIAETEHKGDYYRKQEDTVHSEAISLRHLFVFIRLLTAGLVRDYVIRRFLKAREEIVIKSPICREVVLESRLH
jgi:hypothetical protein